MKHLLAVQQKRWTSPGLSVTFKHRNCKLKKIYTSCFNIIIISFRDSPPQSTFHCVIFFQQNWTIILLNYRTTETFQLKRHKRNEGECQLKFNTRTKNHRCINPSNKICSRYHANSYLLRFFFPSLRDLPSTYFNIVSLRKFIRQNLVHLTTYIFLK